MYIPSIYNSIAPVTLYAQLLAQPHVLPIFFHVRTNNRKSSPSTPIRNTL